MRSSFVSTSNPSVNVPNLTLEQCALLNTEVERLHITNRLINSENDNIKNKFSLEVEENDRLRRELIYLKSQASKIPDLETQIALLAGENSRISSQLIDKIRESDSWKGKFYSVEPYQGKYTLSVVENERLNSLLVEKLREIDALRIRSREADVLEIRTKDLGNDRVRLTESIVEKTRENEGLRNKSAIIPVLEDKVEISEIEKRNLRQTVYDQERVIGDLKLRISAYEREVLIIDELETKIALIVAENQRLTASLSDRLRDVASLRIEVEGNNAKINELTGRNTLLFIENEKLNAILNDRIREVDLLRIKVAELDRANINKAVDLDRANNTINSLQSQVRLLDHENERLNSLLLEKLQIIQEWESKYAILENLYLSIKQTTQELDQVRDKYQNVVKMTDMRLSNDFSSGRKSPLKSSVTLTSEGSPLRKSIIRYSQVN